MHVPFNHCQHSISLHRYPCRFSIIYFCSLNVLHLYTTRNTKNRFFFNELVMLTIFFLLIEVLKLPQKSVAYFYSIPPLNPSLLVAVTQSRLSWHLHTEWHLTRWQTTILVALAPTVDTMRSPIGRRFSVVLAPSRRNILILKIRVATHPLLLYSKRGARFNQEKNIFQILFKVGDVRGSLVV